mmetsp:Transcript_30251/g.66343  ORF Transcript_30251/g.66343 Transcript_30251/m.66343 type:complete len:231 (-) Transcript_30251:210-902(-)|eukprot:2340396-Pleurochrysis_carterae.AAC.1
MLVVAVEGGIGVGKTTVLRKAKLLLEARGYRVRMEDEDIQRWSGSGLLQMMYTSRTPASVIAFQALGPMLDHVRRASRLAHDAENQSSAPAVIMYERHTHTMLDVFTQALVASNPEAAGVVDQFTALLRETDSLANGRLLRRPELLVYLRASPQLCASRTAARGRPEEAGMPLQYLQQLHTLYDSFVQGYPSPTEVCTVEVSENTTADFIAEHVSEYIAKRINPNDTSQQ